MTHTVTTIENNIALLCVDFSDEGVNLQGEIRIPGGEEKALQYLPFFEIDLRNNYSYLFPVSEIIEGGTET